ncbi:DUF2793 domain-containing protein [Phaeovulum veldkampii]|uniref:DUF2793 domain-containing protein n=2 Tax=Phaeovulum veldkampii TaxID=33049 RepID=A0A2T4JMX7_9RHOB|nr:DUF2793 domain-containing protein [Phaeovulum veldkampii]NCU20832.1 DUF2793 domain-containing protein [Candidatus Falkowbacteria bacterium]PTE19274.1 hypothetical protein C5F46_00540 [Phaeovulum veldkampii DSM 11550]TDQ62239.1 uncharacterized protein DUF2793 [Phaeovulum veldkampii DSM 11550]
MTETNRLGLPLLQAAQAQKHVTVNEALLRLDGMVNLVLASRSLTTPPAVVLDGACHGVPAGAVNAWAGQGGRIAVGAGGGWIFVTPQAGWRAFVADEGRMAIHSGEGWVLGALTLGASGAGLMAGLSEVEHAITPGATSTTGFVIPGGAMVIGVTARVSAAISGTLESWQLGSVGAPDRFGSGLGVGLGSWARGMLSQPMTFWAPEPLVLTATGGEFAGGRVKIAVHYLEIGLPGL